MHLNLTRIYSNDKTKGGKEMNIAVLIAFLIVVFLIVLIVSFAITRLFKRRKVTNQETQSYSTVEAEEEVKENLD